MPRADWMRRGPRKSSGLALGSSISARTYDALTMSYARRLDLPDLLSRTPGSVGVHSTSGMSWRPARTAAATDSGTLPTTPSGSPTSVASPSRASPAASPAPRRPAWLAAKSAAETCVKTPPAPATAMRGPASCASDTPTPLASVPARRDCSWRRSRLRRLSMSLPSSTMACTVSTNVTCKTATIAHAPWPDPAQQHPASTASCTIQP